MNQWIMYLTTRMLRKITYLFALLAAKQKCNRIVVADVLDNRLALAKEYGAVFLMGIGWNLADGEPHDGRAADYDDWKLNGDILLYNEVLDASLEISSMGIRVDEKSLVSQLTEANALNRLEFPYHKAVKNGELPLTIGGGIGQSRLCMYLLSKAHIGEVIASVWPSDVAAVLESKGVHLL